MSDGSQRKSTSEASLRRIAVTVERPGAGRFRWRLIEQASADAGWVGLQQAGKSFGTYHAAMAAGLVALEALIDDVDEGPVGDPEVEMAPAPAMRRAAHSKAARSVRATAKEAAEEDAGTVDDEPDDEPEDERKDARAKQGGAFGFGGLSG